MENNKQHCQCCKTGHMVSSFSPRAYCQLCKHPYIKPDGTSIVLDGDEITRIGEGRKTRLQEFIESLDRLIEDWKTDALYEEQSLNVQYANALYRCVDELRWKLTEHVAPVGRKDRGRGK